MASHLKKAEEAKEQGNNFMKATPPDYENALVAYTKALSLDTTSHTAFSNRSLVHFKLSRFEEALSDAEQAIEVAPNWAKGYLRKCAALISLNRNEEALRVAEKGFKLMHSTTMCSDFVSQWLKASNALFLKYDSVIRVPTGIVILSETCFKILLSLISTMTASSAAMNEDMMKESLMKVVTEFEKIIGRFGEPQQSQMKHWAMAISSDLDATVSTIPPELLTSSLQLVMCFVEFLNSSLHVALRPIARPLVALALAVVQARAFALNCANTGHKYMEYWGALSLPFFEKSILNTPEYIGLHLGILTGLVESYVKGGRDGADDLAAIIQHCNTIEALLNVYPTTDWEYISRRDIAQSDLVSARRYVKAKQSGIYEPNTEPKHVSSTELVNQYADALKSLECAKMKEIFQFLIQDADNLIVSAGVFLKFGDVNHTKEALLLAERAYLHTFAFQLSRGVWTLDELQPAVASARWLLLLNVIRLLKDIDMKLMVNIVLRWKGLFSRFRSLLIQEGLGNNYLSTFLAVQHAHTSKIQESAAVKEAIRKHKQKELEFVRLNAVKCLSVASTVPMDAECILESDEIIIDFLEFSDVYSKDISAMYSLVLMPSRDPILATIDGSKVAVLMHLWDKELAQNAASFMLSDTQQSECDQTVSQAGTELSALLFPPMVQKQIRQPGVKHIYIFSNITSTVPLELLPGEDGLPLFKDRALCFASSYHDLISKTQFVESKPDQRSDASTPNDQSQPQERFATCKEKKECCIIANPNYNLHNSQQQTSLWEFVASMWKPTVPEVDMLPNSQAEAYKIAEVLKSHPEINVKMITGDDATVGAFLKLDSPFILHVSTHGFSRPQIGLYRGHFWDDTKSGLILSGYNTYLKQNYSKLVPEAGTGMLNSLGACGLKLSNTRLVFLSMCVSGIGITAFQESSTSLAAALMAAGAETVIASRWNVADESIVVFVELLYSHLFVPGVRPSEALLNAREDFCRKCEAFQHWYNSAGFVCYGLDWPLFP